MENKLIGIKEAAEMLNVSIETLRRWDKEGRLKSVRRGNSNRKYNLSDVVAVMNGVKVINDIDRKILLQYEHLYLKMGEEPKSEYKKALREALDEECIRVRIKELEVLKEYYESVLQNYVNNKVNK